VPAFGRNQRKPAGSPPAVFLCRLPRKARHRPGRSGGREELMANDPSKRDVSFDEVLAGGELSEDKRKRVEELIEEEEGATNRFGGFLSKAITAFAVLVSVFHLYAAVAGSPP